MIASNVYDCASPRGTLVHMLVARASAYPGRTACHFVADDATSRQSLTYGGLLQEAQALGSLLHERADLGDRVLILCPPGLDFVTALFGCQCAGLVAVPTSAPHPRRLEREWPRLRSVLLDCGATVVLTSSALRGPLEELCRRDRHLPPISILACDSLPADEKLAADWRFPDISEDSLALVQYTSGSTGTPRGVMISHGNLLCNLQLIQDAFGTNEESVGVFWLPFHHDMGLIGGLLQTIYCGGESTFFSPVAFVQRPLSWLELISQTRATISGGPNFAYDECVRRISLEAHSSLDLSSWHVAFCGAEPIHAATLDRFTETFADCGFRASALFPCYGLAESTLWVTGGSKGQGATVHAEGTLQSIAPRCSKAEEPRKVTRVSCGFARPGQRVWIVSPETHVRCCEGEIGEIWVAGDSVGQGYWGNPEESQATFAAYTADSEGPFLRTGDLGYFWLGELFVTGRLKDLVIINGRNHFPQDIERTIDGCHPVLRANSCSVFSVAANEQEHLVIVAEADAGFWARQAPDDEEARADTVQAATRAIRRLVAERHEVTPHVVLLVPAFAIPRTSSGKLRRSHCRAEFLSGRFDGHVAGQELQYVNPS